MLLEVLFKLSRGELVLQCILDRRLLLVLFFLGFFLKDRMVWVVLFDELPSLLRREPLSKSILDRAPTILGALFLLRLIFLFDAPLRCGLGLRS